MATLITGTTNYGYRARTARNVFRSPVDPTKLYFLLVGSGAVHIYLSTDELATPPVRQDPAGEPASALVEADGAIDSSGLIGIIYQTNSTTWSYVTFDTVADTWGSPETIASVTASPNVGGSIQFDSADKPHVIFVDVQAGYYANKVGAGWTASPVSLSATIRAHRLLMSASNIPIPIYIVYEGLGGTIYAGLGDQNNATSFTPQAIVANAANINTLGIDAAIDSAGDIWVAYCGAFAAASAGTALMLVQHIFADNWATWQSPATIDATARNAAPSIATKSTDLYIFCRKTSATTGIWYYQSSDAWASGVQILEDSGTSWSTPKARWAFINNPNYNSYPLDLSIFDDTSDEQYWDSINIASAVYKGFLFPRSW